MSVVVRTDGSLRERRASGYRDVDDGPAQEMREVFSELFEDEFLEFLGIDG